VGSADQGAAQAGQGPGRGGPHSCGPPSSPGRAWCGRRGGRAASPP